MYETYFGLERAPFTLSPDPRFLYAAPRTREAFAGVLHGVLDRRGFVVLTGESGTGKSTLLRAVLGEIPAGRLASSLVFNPLVKPDEFLELAMLDFGLTDIPASKPQRLARLQEFLLDNHKEGKINVLFIDEAHTLTPELLEEVRLLTNFESVDTKLLQIVLSGHSELDEMLDRHELRQLKQRIAIRVALRPLQSPNEVGLYMLHRWRKAGAKADLAFLPGAISAIAHFSQGIPRTINSLCDNGLMLAFGAGRKAVDRSMIIDIARDLRLQPAVGTSLAGLPQQPRQQLQGSSHLTLPLPAPRVVSSSNTYTLPPAAVEQLPLQVAAAAAAAAVPTPPPPAILPLPLQTSELPLAPVASTKVFIPADEDLFLPAPAHTAVHQEPAGQQQEEDTTPVLAFGHLSGKTSNNSSSSGGSVIGQWASRFRKATSKP